MTLKIILRHALRHLSHYFVRVLRVNWGKTSTYCNSVVKAHAKWSTEWRNAWRKM